MIKLYEICGFIIHVILVKIDFDKVDELLGVIEVNIVASRKHKGDGERTT